MASNNNDADEAATLLTCKDVFSRLNSLCDRTLSTQFKNRISHMHTCANVHCRNIVCKLHTSHMQIRGGAGADPGFFGRKLIYKGVGIRLADFISICLNILGK